MWTAAENAGVAQENVLPCFRRIWQAADNIQCFFVAYLLLSLFHKFLSMDAKTFEIYGMTYTECQIFFSIPYTEKRMTKQKMSKGLNGVFTNRAQSGRRNLCGERVAYLRKKMQPRVSQRAFAEMLQLAGIDLDKNAIQRIESGQRFVTDIELAALARTLKVSPGSLLEDPDEKTNSQPL